MNFFNHFTNLVVIYKKTIYICRYHVETQCSVRVISTKVRDLAYSYEGYYFMQSLYNLMFHFKPVDL